MSVSTAGSVTVVKYQGSYSRNSCGYCKSPGGSSFALQAQSLTVQHYQCLIDRGWRRGGHSLYKPHMKITCCKHYTIRLNTETFKPSRDQRQCLHKWTRFILGEEYMREAAKKYPKSKEEKKRRKNEFDLSEAVHAPEYRRIESHALPEPAHKLGVVLEPASFTEEKYELYKDYQVNIHKEDPKDIRPSAFKSFLCKSPLYTETAPSGKKLGSYHECYRLNGRLIALAVLDLLPSCVSSVYFIYHSDYEKWHLGKVSACREASFAKEAGYHYYYLGYYIPSCPKMRYKGEYGPQELLDPESNEWAPLNDDLKKQLVDNPEWSVVHPDHDPGSDDPDDDSGGLHAPGFSIRTHMPGMMTANELKAFDIGEVRVGVTGILSTAKNLVGFREQERVWEAIRETVAAVGPEVAREMIMAFGVY